MGLTFKQAQKGIGKKVKACGFTTDYENGLLNKAIGTILDVDENMGEPYAYIEWDKEDAGFHSAGGRGKKGFCWNVHLSKLRFVSEKRAGTTLKEVIEEEASRLKG